ncbi:BQ5605_C003g02336 [Microbotryum silenes-dioicae]|uniref:BQ5605_C003g02336 protein n=1 Tax=Microbotryum silenes-dioicae TaxID=796604 RepID=A0A2X0NYM0_9BASI|nr:BQ5605_C003g02336 [Microbotryum silenes-dioicae]
MSSTPLQDAAEARKAKLAALKKRKTLHDSGAPISFNLDLDGDHDAAPSDVFQFRNYDPTTGTARKHARTDELDTVEKQVEGLADQVIARDEATRVQELDLTNIQPKKPNWDLKRDLDRKLGRLRHKTDQAISQLIRKRLQAEKGTEAAAQVGLVSGFDDRDEDPESDDE